jgi:hypothetical protein
MNRAWSVLAVLAATLACASIACFKPPEIVMVDRATALEQQASGSFEDVERRLNRSAVEPRPVPLTAEQLQALGTQASPRADSVELTDADRVDGLLAQHCIGEGADGLLADTRDDCRGAADADEVLGVVDRINRSRRQLWRWMHEQRADVSLDDLRRSWRTAHLRGVVCGGWIEADDGTWQGKAC